MTYKKSMFLVCMSCKKTFRCHRGENCPDWKMNMCECDTCDTSRRLDADCHTILKDMTEPVKVIFT